MSSGSKGVSIPDRIYRGSAASDPRIERLILSSSVLTDEEADAIRRKLADGWRGLVLLTWLEQLL